MARSVTVSTLIALFAGVLAVSTAPLSFAQGQTTGVSTAATGATGSANSLAGLTDAQLADLVGRIALYPDDLLALILPASTVPLEIVQAQRFFTEAKGLKNPQPPSQLSEPVRNLLNYPDIIGQMNSDLEWTQKLGEAVYQDQEAVMDAVQRFRMMAYSAGNLKSDDKQKVEVNNQTIIIEPAKPDVIYVPRYEPSTVIYASASPSWGYWPTPYPVYYYPYPPGHAFASGLFWGATAAWAFNWHSGGIGWGDSWHGNSYRYSNNNININRNTNINRNSNINRSGSGSGTWNPKLSGSHPYTRPGDAGFKPNIDRNRLGTDTNRPVAENRPGAGNRPNAGAINRPAAVSDRSNLTSTTRPATRPSTTAGTGPSSSVTTRPLSNAESRASTSAESRMAENRSSRARSPQASSYGGMSGQQSRAASERGNASRGGEFRGGGGGERRGGGGHRR